MKNAKRVAIVERLDSLEITPSVTNSVKMWIRNNYLVDYFAIEDRDYVLTTPYLKDENLRIYSVALKKINVPILWGTINLISLIISFFSHCKGKKYECFIGFDQMGLIIATALGRLTNTPVIYHSLDIQLSRYNKNLSRKMFKMLERWCNKRAVYTIIQDEARAKCLIEDNRISNDKVLIVPHTFLLEGKMVKIKKEYLREKLNISGDKKIIIHIGELIRHNMVEELINSVLEWPENCILVLHGWGRKDYLNYLKELAEKNGLYNKRIFISTEILPQEDLDKMVSSADIGVALYHNVDLNFYYMASGKLFHYLKCGLPAIATDFPNLRKVVEENCCGVCINDENGIADAIKEIISDYELFSSNASKCFEEKYEFSSFYQNAIDKISNLRVAMK